VIFFWHTLMFYNGPEAKHGMKNKLIFLAAYAVMCILVAGPANVPALPSMGPGG
jgi:hypothetical protein